MKLTSQAEVETSVENIESSVEDKESDNESDNYNLSVATDSSYDSKQYIKKGEHSLYPKMENTTE